MDKDGNATATLSMAIFDDEVEAREAKSLTVVVLKPSFLKNTDLDGVGSEEIARFRGGVLDTVAIPLGHDEARR